MRQSLINIPDCKRFTGYKPCEPYKQCEGCQDRVPTGVHILLINLDALGDVLVTTAILPALKRKYPQSTIRWLTRRNALPLLLNNSYLDEILEWNDENRLILQAMKFDLVLNADKNLNSCAFTAQLNAAEKLGFGLNAFGAIVPLNAEAEYYYRLGLDDRLKFKTNQRSKQDIIAETFKLDYQRDEYVLKLTTEERERVQNYRQEYGLSQTPLVVGFNTGCSQRFPNKKMTVEQHVYLIRKIATELPEVKILLLGGQEDTERNREIKDKVGDMAIETPTNLGLREGIILEDLCDVIITGDTLGMHIGIALKKYVIAWFGPTSPAEIDFYGRGKKIVSQLPCSPCWNPNCQTLECIHKLDLDVIFAGVKAYYQR